jgi:LysR family nitrogen assimilation transcriptional regulator
MNHIGLRELRSFVYTAELGSLSLAAARLNIVQPAISRHIQSLEGRLGIKLFRRDGRGMKMTARGRRLLVRAAEVLDQVGRIEAEFGERGATDRGELSFAVPPALDDALAIDILGLLRSAWPQARIRMTSMPAAAMVMALVSRQLDLGILACPDQPVPGLATGGAIEERFHLIRAAEAADAAGARTIGLREALAVPLVLPGEDCELRQILEKAAAGRGLALRPALEVDRLSVVVDLVARGQAATILPLHPFRRLLRAGRLQAMKIVDPGVHRSLVVATAAARQVAGTLDGLTDFLAESLASDAGHVPPVVGTDR